MGGAGLSVTPGQVSPVSPAGRPSGAAVARAGWRAWLSLFLALALSALSSFAAAPVFADVLVSNLGKVVSSNGFFSPSYAHAQRFTTGSYSRGYRLDSIEFEIRSNNSQTIRAGTISVELWSASSGRPNRKLIDLTIPSSLSFGFGQVGNVLFKAPPNTVLAANRHYFAFITSGSGNLAMRVTADGNEDAGAAIGWSMENRNYERNPSGRWSVNSLNQGAIKLRVNGAPISTDATLSSVSGSASTDNSDFSSTLNVIRPLAPSLDNYTATVLNSVTHIKLMPTTSHPHATVKVGKRGSALTAVERGSETDAIELVAGDNVIEVEVTAEDGTTTKTYTVTVTKLSGKKFSIRRLLTATEGTDAQLQVALGEVPLRNIVFVVTYDYSSGGASSDDTHMTPTSVEVTADNEVAILSVPLFDDELVENDEEFGVSIKTAPIITGWTAAGGGSESNATVIIQDNDTSLAKIAFGTDAAATSAYTMTVAERVGSYDVPVTVSHLPGVPVVFDVEVLSTGTATDGTDYLIATKSVTFGPNSNKTQNIAVSIIHDDIEDPDETIQLRIVAADSPVDDLGDHYARDAMGATATITLTDVQKSSDADLSALAMNISTDNSNFSATLDLGFSTEDTSYQVHPANAVTHIKLTPTTRNSYAKIKVGKSGSTLTAVESGSQSDAIELDVGDNVIEVEVTAEDGTTKTYTVTVTKLSGTTYSITRSLTATEGKNAELQVALGQNAPIGGITFNVTYLHTSGGASEADITSTINEVMFSPGDTRATLSVPLVDDELVENDEQFTVSIAPVRVTGWTPTVSGASNATVTIQDNDAQSAKIAFGSDAAATGAYTATVAENVSGGSIDVPVTVSHLPSSSVTFNVEVLSTGTATEDADYAIATKSVTFGPDSAKTQNIAVSIIHDRPTDDGETIQLRIVAADSPVDDLGDHYERDASGATATITLKDVEQSGDANLSALVINTSSDNKDFSGTLDFDFKTNIQSYGLAPVNTVAYIKLTPTASEPNATMEIRSVGSSSITPIESGMQSDAFALVVGETLVLSIRVTSQNGASVQQYNLTFARQKSTDATLSALSGITSTDGLAFGASLRFNETFSADKIAYTATVPFPVTHVKLTPTVTKSEATVKVGVGTRPQSLADVTSGTASAALRLVGRSILTIEVTAPDRTTKKTYTVTVTQQGICGRTQQVRDQLLNQIKKIPQYQGVSDCAEVTGDQLFRVTDLSVRNMRISALKDGDFDGLLSLERLSLDSNLLTSLPDLSDLRALQRLDVSFNPLTSLPDLSHLTRLLNLTAQGNNLTSLPDLSQITELSTLNLKRNNLTSLPDLRQNTKIVLLSLQNNPLSNLSALVLGQVGGSAIALNETFSGSKTDYTANLPSGVTRVNVTPTAADKGKLPGGFVSSHPAPTIKAGRRGTTLRGVSDGSTSPPISFTADNNVIEVEVTGRAHEDERSGQTKPTKTYTITLTRLVGKTYSITQSAAADEGASARLQVNLGERVTQSGGITFDVTYTYPSDGASSDDTGTTVSTVTVANNASQADLDIPLAADSLLENDEQFEVSIAPADGVSGWSAANADASTATVTIKDKQAPLAKVAFGSDAAATTAYTVRVKENVSGGSFDVPVTVSHLPAASATFTVQVLSGGTATETDDYSIATKSVTFGPTDTDNTQNVAVSVEHDAAKDELDETILLRLAPATSSADLNNRYARDAKGATATIVLENVVQSSDATLKSLTANTSTDNNDFTATLNFGTFTPGTETYTVQVANAVKHVTLTPTVNEENATVKVGKTGTTLSTVASGDASDAIALDIGDNAIKVEVTAHDGTTVKTYTVTVTREQLPPGEPTGLTVKSGDAKLTLTWTAPAEDPDEGDVAGYDVHYTSGTTSGPGTVEDDADAMGSNPAAGWVAVSRSGTTASQEISGLDNNKEYRVRVRSVNSGGNSAWLHQTGTPKSSDATLSTLTGSTSTDNSNFDGTLDFGTFAPETLDYTATVVHAVTHVRLTPTVNEPNATVKVGKTGGLNTVGSGAASTAIELEVGDNDIEVEVTAHDGSTTKTYTVTVTRQSNDATLSTLTGTTSTDGTNFPGTLDIGTFAAATEDYTASVPNAVTYVKLLPTVNESNATVEVGKTGGSLSTVDSGTASAAIPVDVGSNSIEVKVTAQDGTEKTYTVVVTRQPKPPGAPTGLTVTVGDAKLSLAWTAPAADPATGDVASYDVHYTSAPKDGDGAVTDEAAASGTDSTKAWVAVSRSGTTASQEITSLSNSVAYRVRVRSVNGGGNSSWLHETGTPLSSDATLRALTVNTSTDNSDFSATLDFGAFAAQTVTYTVAVVNAVTHLKVTATVNESNATVEIGKSGALAAATSATASDAIPLELGDNAIEVKVTAQDGTENTYTITVTRQSNDATLRALSGSTSTDGSDFSGTLDFGTFAATTETYTATVENAVTHVKLTPAVTESNATVKVGKADALKTVATTAASEAIELAVGDNPIKVEVTAQDGTKKTYTVTVTRLPLPPGLPTGLTVNAGDEKLTLTWTAPAADSATGAVAGYDVHYTSAPTSGNNAVANGAEASGNDASAAWVAVTRSGTAVTQEIADLDNGTTYRVRVRASNSGGASAWVHETGRPLSSDATLSALKGSVSTDNSDFSEALSIGAFSSDPARVDYTATVANAVTHVKLTATVNDSNATVQIGKTGSLSPVDSGIASDAIALDAGANAIKVEVTAQDGTKKTYTVTVNRQRAPPSVPAGVSSETLVSNFMQTRDSNSKGTNTVVLAQQFTTGAASSGYSLSGIEARFRNTAASATRNLVRAELWSSQSNAPNTKLQDLTVPSAPINAGTVSFPTPASRVLEAWHELLFRLVYHRQRCNTSRLYHVRHRRLCLGDRLEHRRQVPLVRSKYTIIVHMGS